MYLSRVEIDIYNRQKMRNLNHLGAFHNWVEQSFPEEIKSDVRSRKLWRIDSLKGKKYLLIVSKSKPDAELLEKYGVRGTSLTKDYLSFLNLLKNDITAKFRVTLNPVVSIKNIGDMNDRGRTVPHITIAHQMKFLLDRAEKNGFSLNENDFKIVERGFAPFKKRGEKSIMLNKVSYEGILKIIDAKLFKDMLINGFGKKKAYGFGMMTVILIRQSHE